MAIAPAPVRFHRPLPAPVSLAWALSLLLLGLAWPAFVAEARAQTAPAPATAPAPPADQPSYDLILLETGSQKINVIKQIREAVPGTGLAQAKGMTESTPKAIGVNLTQAEALSRKEKFEAVGAKVALKLGGAKPWVPEPASPPLPPQASYEVFLTEVGPSQVAVTVTVRDANPGMTLSQASTLVDAVAADNVPRLIRQVRTAVEAEEIRTKLRALRAKVIVK